MSRPRRQCAKCPWKVSTDPHDIPNGYDVGKHHALARTIAVPGSLEALDDTLHIFGCHKVGKAGVLPCVGWLAHQLGPGNNIALRLRAWRGSIDANIQTVGPQHERFEDTLPAEDS